MQNKPRPPRRPPKATHTTYQEIMAAMHASILHAAADATDAMRDATLLDDHHAATQLRQFRDRLLALGDAVKILARRDKPLDTDHTSQP